MPRLKDVNALGVCFPSCLLLLISKQSSLTKNKSKRCEMWSYLCHAFVQASVQILMHIMDEKDHGGKKIEQGSKENKNKHHFGSHRGCKTLGWFFQARARWLHFFLAQKTCIF